MNIKVIADSTCDLPQELLQKYDISITPLYIIKDGKDFRDGITITPKEIFDHVAAGGDLCTTSAVSVGEYQDIFARYASVGYADKPNRHKAWFALVPMSANVSKRVPSRSKMAALTFWNSIRNYTPAFAVRMISASVAVVLET